MRRPSLLPLPLPLALALAFGSGCAGPKPSKAVAVPVGSVNGGSGGALPGGSPAVAEPSDEDLTKRGLVMVVESHGAGPRRKPTIRPIAQRRRFQIGGQSVLLAKTTVQGQPRPVNSEPLTQTHHVEIATKPAAHGQIDCDATNAGEVDPGSSCKLTRTARGGLSRIELLTGDQTTGDADDEGDGLSVHWAWPVVARVALRLSSTPLPDEELGAGARWHVWERVRVDHVWTRRHARVDLLGWTDAGARLKVSVDEIAATQTYTGFEAAAEEARGQLAELEKQLGGKIEITLTPEAQAAARMAFPRKTLHGAKQHAEGEIEVDFGDALPVNARLEAKASYDQELPTMGGTIRETGEVTRTILVKRAP